MQGSSIVFFLLFAIVLMLMYMALRREWAGPGVVAGVGVLGSVITMTLMSLAQGNAAPQALIVGILIGGIFSGAILAIAWYFHNAERHQQFAAGEHSSRENPPAADEYYEE